jgi:hypothetical protein
MENLMRSRIMALGTAAALAGAAVLATSTGAEAQRWYRGWAPGVGIGLAAGAVVGGAVAAATAPWYGPAYYGGWTYGPAYYGAADAYDYGVAPGYTYGYSYPNYAYAPAYGDAYAYSEAPAGGTGYCARRYRSYDPASGTYMGYDGVRHVCR